MDLIEGLIKSRSTPGSVLNELTQVMQRYHTEVNLNPVTTVEDDGTTWKNIIRISEPDPLPPLPTDAFGTYCYQHDVDSRLQAELKENGVNALVVLSRGILELFTKC